MRISGSLAEVLLMPELWGRLLSLSFAFILDCVVEMLPAGRPGGLVDFLCDFLTGEKWVH